MSDWCYSAAEAVERLSRHDPTLKIISVYDQERTDAELVELMDCLLAHPDVVTTVYLGCNQLTDETGVRVARYLAASSTVECLNMEENQIGEATYLAVAAALRVNSSLQYLHLLDNRAVDLAHIHSAFVEALRLNPDHPAESVWWLGTYGDEFKRLKIAAEQLGHPSLQMLLALMSD